MKKILLLFVLLLFAMDTKADIVKVDNLYVEVEKTVGTNRGYTLPEGSTPNNNFALGLDLTDDFEIIYLNNKISTTTDKSQFRYGGLDMELGINTTLNFQLYYRHYSGHLIDAQPDIEEDGRFPEENVIGIRFNLL